MTKTGVEWGGRGVEWGGRGNELRGNQPPRHPASAATSSARLASKEPWPAGLRRQISTPAPAGVVVVLTGNRSRFAPGSGAECASEAPGGGICERHAPTSLEHPRQFGSYLVTGLVAAVAVVLWSTLRGGPRPRGAPVTLPLVVFVVAFAATELVDGPPRGSRRGSRAHVLGDPVRSWALLFAAPGDGARSPGWSADSSCLGSFAGSRCTSCSSTSRCSGSRRPSVRRSFSTLLGSDDPVAVEQLAGCVPRARSPRTLLSTLAVTLAITRLQRLARQADGRVRCFSFGLVFCARQHRDRDRARDRSIWERELLGAPRAGRGRCALFAARTARTWGSPSGTRTSRRCTTSPGRWAMRSRSPIWRRRWPAGHGRSCAVSTWRSCCRPSGTVCRPAACWCATRTCSAPTCPPTS